MKCRDFTLLSNGESSNNINVTNGNLLDKVTSLGEYLHPRPLIASVTHNVLATVSHYCNFARVPQLTFFTTFEKTNKILKKFFFPTLIFCSLILSEMYPFYKLNICINQKRKSTLMCSLSEQVGGKVLMGSSPFQPFLEPILERLCIHDAFFLLSYPNFSSIFTP